MSIFFSRGRPTKSTLQVALLMPRLSLLKKGSTGYDGYKKVKGNKLSALADRNDLSLSYTVTPSNIYDSQFYEPTSKYLRFRGSRSISDQLCRSHLRYTGSSPVQPETRHQEQYPGQSEIPDMSEKRSAFERFFSWIEALKKITPWFERYEYSSIGLIYLACTIMIWRDMGWVHPWLN